MLEWLGLTSGEFFVVAVLTVFIVSAGYWPKAGAWVALRLMAPKKEIEPRSADK
jgi:hypothetical protein